MIPDLHEFLARVKSLFRKRRMDRELADELEFHQALLRERLQRQGIPPSEADQATRRAFGNANRWQERLRELRQFHALENFWRDLNFSARLLRKSPGFTTIALLTLALGIGANTAVFSLINGLLLRPLAVPHAEQLAVLRMEQGGPQPDYFFITPFFRNLENRHDVFSNVFAYIANTLQVQGHSGNENIHGMLVSGQFFQGLQVPPLMGRYLTPADDQKGGNPAGLGVVISERFWESWFDRAPDVVGRKLIIANVPFTVVGVMPKRFIGPDPTQRPDIFAPLTADPIINAPGNHIDAGIHAWWLNVMARLQPGISLEQANAELLTISDPILRESSTDPDFTANEERAHFHFSAEQGSSGYTDARILFRKPLVAMFSMCIGILLLACLNLTSLLMARGAARERELATRLAMGATRKRLIHQLLAESLLLAMAGTALGLAAAPLVSHALAAMLMSGTHSQGVVLDASLDGHVFLFAVCIAIFVTVLVGVAPALQATGKGLNDAIKEGQHASKAHERKKILPPILMTLEVALALVLISGAGLLAMSLVRLYQSGAGFDPRGLVNIAFSMDKQPLEGDPLMQVYQQLDDGLSHLPGVKNVSFQFIVPLSGRGWNGRYMTPGGRPKMLMLNSVAPNYFATMRIPLYQGREFQWSDTNASGLKMILNQSAAKLLFPDGDALGRQIVDFHEKTSYEVVAVVGDTKYRNMRSLAPAAGYVPIMQDPQKKPSLNAVVRIDGPSAPLTEAVRSLTAHVAPTIPAPVLTPMKDMLDDSLSAERMMALLSVFFAGCALLITAIGLYGTLAYATARRTNEIGIRMALGAQRERVVAMVFRQNAIIAIAGCVAGLIAAIMVSRVLVSFLYEISPHDPWVLLLSITILMTIASAASLLPALRAARIDPIAAIRCD